MAAAYAVLLVGLVVVAGAGALVYVTTPTRASGVQTVLGKLGAVRDTCVDEFGRYGGAVLVLLAASAASVIVPWPFGRLARRELHSIDLPFYRWSQNHVTRHGTFHHLNAGYTHLGNRPLIKVVLLVAAVIFAALWARRGFWIPPVVLAAAFGFEKFGQLTLAKVVARQRTPLFHDLGTYPSGGCARFIVTYGTLVYLATLTWPAISRRIRIGAFTVVAMGAWVEGYTRLFLLKHWLMDVIGGWLFGTLMLLALIAATSCFAGRAAPEDPSTDRVIILPDTQPRGLPVQIEERR